MTAYELASALLNCPNFEVKIIITTSAKGKGQFDLERDVTRVEVHKGKVEIR